MIGGNTVETQDKTHISREKSGHMIGDTFDFATEREMDVLKIDKED